MAHIVSCMLDLDQDDLSPTLNYIAKVAAEQEEAFCNESLGRASPAGEKPFSWRMQQQQQQQQQTERKYQLFPVNKPTNVAPGKALDPEQAFALAMGQNGDGTTTASGLRIRIKENSLVRRRKISVPELGPMTTVHEIAMDSPTIPGHHPIHERSVSAPGNSWRAFHATNGQTCGSVLASDEKPELKPASWSQEESQKPPNEGRRPMSPKNLTPLVIPNNTSTVLCLTRQMSLNRLRSGNTSIDTPLRSAKTDDSPRARTPFTPFSATITPKSAATTTISTSTTNSTLPTPMSAPVEARASPKPWDPPTNCGIGGTQKTETIPELPATTTSMETNDNTTACPGHRRIQSESASIMERGRPRKRAETVGCASMKRSGSKRSKSSERRAFEVLPKGWKAVDAVNTLSPQEISVLQKQALQQAGRFEVLRKEDVDNLSRELRQLDERCEYLRRTYTSLRAGRRNLHTRICQYLRSPRTAKFSVESILKQEEALAELDSSIDDWITKLEQAENRRTRVRQKLLEHVAAAVTLAVPNGNGVVNLSETLQLAIGVRPLNAANNISVTPPRSPVKTTFSQPTPSPSPPPQRAAGGAHVPSTIIEQPLFEDPDIIEGDGNKVDEHEGDDGEKKPRLRRAETIRVYADTDVYALLADVEHTITNMGNNNNNNNISDARPESPSASAAIKSKVEQPQLPCLQQLQQQHQQQQQQQRPPYPPPQNPLPRPPSRNRSCDMVTGSSARKPLPISKLEERPSFASLKCGTPPPLHQQPAPPPPPAKDKRLPEEEEPIYLPATVFKPDR